MRILVILVLFRSVLDAEGAILSSKFEASLNSFIQTSMKCHHIPGMTLAIVKGISVIIIFFLLISFSIIANLKVPTITAAKRFIRITDPCDIYPLRPHFYIVKLGFTGVYIILIFALKHILCVLVRTCTHNICFAQKYMKIMYNMKKKKTTENCHFYSREKSLYIACACFRKVNTQPSVKITNRLDSFPVTHDRS